MKINKINEKINKAHELYKNQNFDEADKILLKLISNKIINDKIYFLYGLINGAKNLNEQAAKNFKSAIKLNSKESVYFFNLAIALNEIGNHQEALINYEKTIKLDSQNVYAWLNYGNVYRNLKKFKESINCYQKALKIKEDFDDAKLNIGLSLIDLTQYEESIKNFKDILIKNNNNVNALAGIALALMMSGKYDDALEFSNKCIKLNNDNIIAISNRGIIYNHLKQYKNALNDFDHVLSKDYNNVNALVNKGISLKRLYKYELAKENLKKALKLNPKNVDALCNIAGVYSDENQVKLSEENYEKALKYNPNSPEANYGLAYINLGNLNFEKGWKYFEWRFLNKKTNIKYFQTSKKEWNGNLNIKKLFVWAEQGIGDQIMFGSILKDIELLPINITVYVNEKILKLFKRSFNKLNFISSFDKIAIEDYDEHISLIALAKIYRKSINDFTDKSGSYLIDEKEITKKIELKKDSKKTCGISWKSINIDIGFDKSIPIKMFKEIFNLENYEFINLQYGDISDEIDFIKNKLNKNLFQHKNIDLFEDIDSLASIIKSCDVVITSSNSTAHLAGALGVNTFLLIPKSRGKLWYWTSVEGKSYWYKSIKIFKQIKPNSWIEPLQDIANQLKKI